jgi:hypothetical protein
MADPRMINLNLPSDYFSKPTTAFLNWLAANAATLRLLSEDQIIQRARNVLGSDLSRLNNGDLAAQIRQWAKTNGYTLPGGGGAAAARAGDPEVVDRLKKLFASIPTEVKWVVAPGGSVAIDVSGATLDIDVGKAKSAVSVGWDKAVQLKTEVSGMTFEASVGPQNWSMTFTIGRKAPNLSDMESVFKKGEAAIRGVLSNLDKVDFRDPGKTKNQFSPYLDPIKAAVDAASKTAALRPGEVSVGAWVQGTMPGSGTGTPGAGGVTAGVGVTITF